MDDETFNFKFYIAIWNLLRRGILNMILSAITKSRFITFGRKCTSYLSADGSSLKIILKNHCLSRNILI